MDAGLTWERLLHTPTTWIVVAAVLFVLAVVLLVAGARAGRRAARAQREQAATEAADAPAASVPAPAPGDQDDDPVTEPAVPRQATPAPVTLADAEEDPVTEPAAPRPAAPAAVPATSTDPATRRLLAALVGDPTGAVAAVAALGRGEEPGRAAVTLLRSGVPAPAVARLCGVDPDDLAGLVASTLGVLPHQARAVVAAR